MGLSSSQADFSHPGIEQFRGQAVDIITQSGMIRESHWRFAAGDHASIKAVVDFAENDPDSLTAVASMMSALVVDAVEVNDLPIPDAVVGVPTGAESLADRMLPFLREAFDKDIVQVFTTKFPDYRPVRFWVTDPANQTSGLEKIRQEGVSLLGIEDVTTTWGSTRGSMEAIKAAGSTFHGKNISGMGMVSFAERQGSERDQPGDPIRLNVVDLFVDQWAQEFCDDCTKGVPVDEGVGLPASREIVEQVLTGWPQPS